MFLHIQLKFEIIWTRIGQVIRLQNDTDFSEIPCSCTFCLRKVINIQALMLVMFPLISANLSVVFFKCISHVKKDLFYKIFFKGSCNVVLTSVQKLVQFSEQILKSYFNFYNLMCVVWKTKNVIFFKEDDL